MNNLSVVHQLCSDVLSMLCLTQDKIDVNGGRAHPLYKLLKDKQPQDLPNAFMIPGEKGKIQWNYTSKTFP